MKRRLFILLIVTMIVFVLAALGAALYLQHPKFGASPQGERLATMERSPHYTNGQFENVLPTPRIVSGNLMTTLWSFLFAEKERPMPLNNIPSIKTNLAALDKNKDVVIWLGHSSYYIQLGGKTFLIDPVFSDYAAPVSVANRAFTGANPYTADDIPTVDYLLISHDHWDHLDYPTVMSIKSKVKNIICPLGVGAYFEQWGFTADTIREGDWFNNWQENNGLAIHLLPARHYSGRLLKTKQTLWGSFALITPKRRLFFSGDSGYGPHFAEIGKTFGGFDLVILENGQYDKKWPYIHMAPEETAQAAVDLNGKALLPAHAGKFALANHPWDEPYRRITDASKQKDFRLLTPMIGEPLLLDEERQEFSHWWEGVE